MSSRIATSSRLLSLALATTVIGLGAIISPTAAMAGGSTSVGVSVSVAQPGFYGRVDIGDQPAPAIIYPQPVIIQQTPVAVYQRPIYMHVPPGHYKNWARYCGVYRACGQPVYFVRDDDRRWRDRDDRRDWDRRDHDRRDDDDRDDDRGHGHGHGRGHGHGHDRD